MRPLVSEKQVAGQAKQWCLYLLECSNGSLYAGITNDLQARFTAHQAGRGAKYTKAHKPVRIVGSATFGDRSLASKAEWALKQLPRAKKVATLALWATSGCSATGAHGGAAA